MDIVEQVLFLYFKEKYKQKDIAIKLNISKYKVSRIVSKDNRYKEEKIERKEKSKAKNKKETIEYMKNKRRSSSSKTDYDFIRAQHDQASRILSGGRKPINNKTYRDWNTSIYQYNEKTKSYNLKKGINVGFDVPKKISWKNF